MQSSQLHTLGSPSPVDIGILKSQTSKIEIRNTTVKLWPSLACGDVFSNIATSLHTSIDKRNPEMGFCIHAKILKSGLDSSIYVGNSLLNMYVKCRQFEDAVRLFEEMPNRTVVSWTSMIWGYCQKELADNAISLFRKMLEALQPNEYTLAVMLQACALKRDHRLVQEIHSYVIKYGFTSDNFLLNSLIDAYAESGKLEIAEKLLGTLFSSRDVVSWTSVISGCVRNGMEERALLLFSRMQEDGIMPNEVTILSILQACSRMSNWKYFRWIHGLIMKAEWCTNSLVMNSLVEMYSTNGYFKEGRKIFCNLCFCGEGLYLRPETMANLLHECGDSGFLKLGEEIHGYLIKHGFFPCTVLENSLIGMYGEKERVDSALQLFRMRSKDVISWNSMLTCLVKNEQFSEALDLLSEIHINGSRYEIFPDFVMMLMSIQACSNLSSLHLGQIIHGYLTRTGLVCDIFVQNSLIDFYAKSGRLDFSRKIFDEMNQKDLGSWNSMIAAYGMNGNGTSALTIYSELKESRAYQPNEITFVNILSACAHAGLVKIGFDIFNQMNNYDVEPSMEHFACMVDLLGRSGKLEEAQDFIEKMPLKAGPDVWGALLGACSLFGNVAIAERAGKALSVLEPKSKVWRVALSNIYANAGRWEDVANLRAEMRRSEEMRKEGGWSSVEVKGDVFSFMVGDIRHPQTTVIYKVLNGLHEHMRNDAMLELGVS